MDLGARPMARLPDHLGPQALPGILAGVMIGFAISLDEFILTFLVTALRQTAAALYLQLVADPGDAGTERHPRR